MQTQYNTFVKHIYLDSRRVWRQKCYM